VSYESPYETTSDLLKSSASFGSSDRVATPIVVSDLAGLRSLSKSRPFRSREPIAIQLPNLSTEEAEALSARINGYRNDCGCSLGAKSMAAGFLITVLWLCVSYGVFTTRFLLALPFAFLFAFVCAGAGKATGVFLARRRLRLELDRFQPNSHPSLEGDSICRVFGHN